MTKIRVIIGFEQTQIDPLRRIAREQQTSVAAIIRRAVAQWLAREQGDRPVDQRSHQYRLSLTDRQYARLYAEATSKRTTVAQVIARLLDDYVELADRYVPIQRRRSSHRGHGQ
jgi:hypothetical protein